MGKFLVCIAIALLWITARLHAQTPIDTAEIQKNMTSIITFLDSKGYANRVSWHEHIKLTFELAVNRLPNAVETALIERMKTQYGLKRSQILLIALGSGKEKVSWYDCSALLQRIRREHFVKASAGVSKTRAVQSPSKNEIIAALKEMEQTSQQEESVPSIPHQQRSSLTQSNEIYITYFGFLHAHCKLSDGSGSALEAYAYARDQAKLDFFSLTDHGEMLLYWPWQHKWQKLVNAANDTYQPGKFVSFWGFEWSSPLFGHINVINSSDYTNTYGTVLLTNLYDWIGKQPHAFGIFNHPGDYDDLGLEFYHLANNPSAVNQMVGIENWNGSQSFDKYYYNGSWTNEYSFLDVGNRNGWRLGALGAQDNHQKDWGTQNQFRTAVLATELTREALIDAYQNRRFYATEDSDLFLDVRCSGYPIGAELSGVEPTFFISASDKSGDAFSQARLYKNGDCIQSQEVSGSAFTTTLSDPSPGNNAYYYVIIRQQDDNDGNGRPDEAISSAIFIY
ncbi:CehA/McbA family metallohydrolase [bacterium]|nr:CehA/McbA family metallohydrolase [candidate division CSSED10-310 bacterium]